jgi:dTMP kinase
MAEGKFIVLEGADCTGKSTIAVLLSEWMAKNNLNNIITRHPGSTAFGQEVRAISKGSKNNIPPIAEGLLMAADNNAFIEDILKPNLNEGTWVIGDRNNFISSMAYQIMSGASFGELDAIHKATHPNPPKIDLLFILRADDEDRNRRQTLKSGGSTEFRGDPNSTDDRYESRGNDYVDGVVRAYDQLMEEQHERLLNFVAPAVEVPKDIPTPRCLYIDASKPVGEVLGAITENIKALLLEESTA